MAFDRTLQVSSISADQHYQFIAQQKSASFLQSPAWASTKPEWRSESLGWWDGDVLVATSLVLFRPIPVPGLRGRYLAYLADGPIFNIDEVAVESVLEPLIPFLKKQGAFLVRVGLPLNHRIWDAAEVRKSLSDGTHESLTDLEPVMQDPRIQTIGQKMENMGWEAPTASDEFEAGQPRFQARVPIPQIPVEDRSDRRSAAFQAAVDEVLKGMGSTSRNETRRSTRSELTVWEGGPADVHLWQKLYEETAERENFRPRPPEYFVSMYNALNATPTAQCRFLFAQYEEKVLASAVFVQQQDTSWYLYGASTREESKRYAPRALQLEQIQLSIESGATWYDHGGVSPTLDKSHPLAGLTRFKTSLGADIFETFGEWDYPVSKTLTKAFNLYMNRRG